MTENTKHFSVTLPLTSNLSSTSINLVNINMHRNHVLYHIWRNYRLSEYKNKMYDKSKCNGSNPKGSWHLFPYEPVVLDFLSLRAIWGISYSANRMSTRVQNQVMGRSIEIKSHSRNQVLYKPWASLSRVSARVNPIGADVILPTRPLSW